MSVLKETEHLRLSLNEIELATNNFNEPIGKGGYGMVYKGELCISGRPTTVAVKTLGENSGQGLKQFLTEIQLLTGLNHKNVISLLGYCEDYKHKSLVYEYAARGSLDTYLGVGSKISLTWKKRLEICRDAAHGLNHLHSNIRKTQTIIHRDIKSANILLDDNWVAKIADLGLSKLYFENSEENSIVSDACGTPGYCDPKYLDGILRKEYDVYSFGIVLFEVLCGRLCNFQYKKDGFVLSSASVQKYYEENKMKEIIDPCLREEMSLYSINKFSEVAYKCLLKDERQRPSMDRIVKDLEDLLLYQAIEVESLKSNSCSSDPISKLRYEKVRRIFGRFDVDGDGVLNKKELAYFFHLLGQHMDGTLTKIEHMNLMETKQGFKHKYFGPRALRKYHGKLEKFTLPIKNLYRTWVPSREIAKIIDTIFSFFGESTNGEIGLTRDGMLRFYDYGVDDLHDHFEFLRLDYKPFDNDEDSFQMMERYEKVKRIFQRCDINKDGYLDIKDLLGFIVINSQDIELQFNRRVKHIFHWYCLFIEGDKGLDCDGLFKFYNSGIDSLDDDFEKLNLKLKPFEEHELALRYEKVRRIFQRFDINEDGGLDEDELMEYIDFKRSPEVKNDEAANSMTFGHIFSLWRELTKGEKGLTCDGFLLGYEFSVDGLDDDFKKLRLDLKPLDDREDALRKRERAEKVRIMFERFDLNGDGGLDKQELGSLLLKRNPHKEALKEVTNYVDKVFRWYAEYIDGDKGLTCDGLLRTYDHGIDSLDVDFETLGLELRKSVETEDASRKRVRSEKVGKILKRFDFNGDGGLNRKEMAFYLAAVHPEDKLSEEEMTKKVNHMFQILGEFVDGVIGLSCDGLIRKYDYGEDNLDAHFKILKLR